VVEPRYLQRNSSRSSIRRGAVSSRQVPPGTVDMDEAEMEDLDEAEMENLNDSLVMREFSKAFKFL